jgi:hypothetical protein
MMIAATLLAYDDWIIIEATHPRTGIQFTEQFKSWPPNPGEMKAFCDDMAKRSARYAVYDLLPKPDLTPRPPPVPNTTPGRCANCWVSNDLPHYAAMVEMSKTADPKDWVFFENHPKYGSGIRVPFEWYPRRGGTVSQQGRTGFRSAGEVADEWLRETDAKRLSDSTARKAG